MRTPTIQATLTVLAMLLVLPAWPLVVLRCGGML